MSAEQTSLQYATQQTKLTARLKARPTLSAQNVLSKITLPGSIFLAFVAILPAIVRIFGVNSQFAQFYGGTSLLIMVGVVLDTLQQIESHLLMRHYDGLLESGRIRGPRSNAGAY